MTFQNAQWQEALVALVNTSGTTTLPTIVQQGHAVTGSGAKTVAFTFTNKVGAGNSIVVDVGLGEVVDDSTIICTITDSEGNTYTRAAQASQSTTQYAAIYYTTNVAGDPVTPSTVTLTLTGASSVNAGLGIQVREVSGIIELTPAAVDQTGTGNGTGTSVTTSAVVPVTPNELAFMVIAAGNGVITAGSGWTLDSGSLAPTGGNLVKFGSQSRFISALGSITPAATLGSSVAWAAACATFKPALEDVQGTVTLASGAAVTANAGTNLNTSLLALEAGGNLASLVTNTADLLADGDNLASILTAVNKLIAPSINSGTIDATTQRVVAGGAATGTKSNVASSASSVTILASNTSRKGAIVYNDSTQVLYLDLSGGTASSTSYTVQMGPNTFFELPGPNLYNGAITGIWASANGNARVTEFS